MCVCVCVCVCVCRVILILQFGGDVRGAFNKFTDFFVQAFKIIVDACKLTMLLLYML